MKIIKTLSSLVGGLIMVIAFFQPWASITIMGFTKHEFTGLGLSERDPLWFMVGGSSFLILFLALIAVVLMLSNSDKLGGYFGVAILPLALVALGYLAYMLLQVYGEGLASPLGVKVTAASIDLHLLIGVPLEIAGAFLAAVGGALFLLGLKKAQ